MCRCCNDARNNGCGGSPDFSCLESPDCTGPRPRGAVGSGKCRCVEEECWNRPRPPIPDPRWPSNFYELRRRWSEYIKRQSCPCDDCRKKKVLPLQLECRGETRPNDQQSYAQECFDDYSGYHEPSASQQRQSRPHDRTSCRSAGSSKGCNDRTTGFCQCQPQRRDCCCPSPVQIDARSDHPCSCESIPKPECPCPPNERRFPRPTQICTVAVACAKAQAKEFCSRSTSPTRENRIVVCPPSGRVKSKHKCKVCTGGKRPGLVGITSFALLILVAVAWALGSALESASSRPRCSSSRTTYRLPTEWFCSPCSMFSFDSKQRQIRESFEEPQQLQTRDAKEQSSSSDRSCRIVCERTERIIIENEPRVADNEASDGDRKQLASRFATRPQHCIWRLPPFPNSDKCNSHKEEETRRLNRACAQNRRESSVEIAHFDLDTPEPRNIVENNVTEKVNETCCNYGVKRTNQLFENLRCSSSQIQSRMKKMNLDSLTDRKSMTKISERGEGKREGDTLSPCLDKKSEKCNARKTLKIDYPDPISTIDLHSPRFTVGCADDKRRKKAKNKKSKNWSKTLKYYISPRKSVSDDHKRLPATPKKYKKNRFSIWNWI